MNPRARFWHAAALILFTAVAMPAVCGAASDPLPSWTAGPAKAAITSFVRAVTARGSGGYVAPEDRIAVFDNDGTLWPEQPAYVQLAFAMDRVKGLIPAHPEWLDKPPFRAVADGDVAGLSASGERGLLDLVMASHAGMTTDEFSSIVTKWLTESRHPRFKRAYTDLAYQPMVELLGYLRANGFRTFIVSGGGIEFMRTCTRQMYGVPPEQVIGSSIEVQYEVRDGRPVLVRLPRIDFLDDKAGKPVAMHRFIGRRPIAAFGNSDGDFEMLEWVSAGAGPRFGLIVHHDDAEREYAYDRKSPFGRLDRALDEAPGRGWTVVSMKRDWKRVFRNQ